MEEILVEIKNLRKLFPLRRPLLGRVREFVRAVDGVSFRVKKGEIFGLVGMSGCGKTTCGKLLVRLLEPGEGEIFFKKNSLQSIRGSQMRNFRRQVQMVFQDPYESLNPRINVSGTVSEPLLVQGMGGRRERRKLIRQILEKVGLLPPEEFIFRYPHELSGGQRQRVAIARALVIKPEFLVADEPVSMLDASIGAGIMNLLLDLRREFNLTFVFITHDLAGARYLTDSLAIMYLGKIVEQALTEEVIANPLHPYTRMLIAAVPQVARERKRGEISLKGELPSPLNRISGCRFYPCCPERREICFRSEPLLQEVEKGHLVACHLIRVELKPFSI